MVADTDRARSLARLEIHRRKERQIFWVVTVLQSSGTRGHGFVSVRDVLGGRPVGQPLLVPPVPLSCPEATCGQTPTPMASRVRLAPGGRSVRVQGRLEEPEPSTPEHSSRASCVYTHHVASEDRPAPVHLPFRSPERQASHRGQLARPSRLTGTHGVRQEYREPFNHADASPPAQDFSRCTFKIQLERWL